jgi:sodium-dependent phosphate cotransporter
MTQQAYSGQSESVKQNAASRAGGWTTWIALVALVYLLLVGVGLIGEGFKWLSGGAAGAEAIFAFASNPIVGVILGTLATALVQSSSTVTAVIVGLVAGGAPVAIAIPMIMGANMGTTITNTIVSLGGFSERQTFNRSFQAATVHDFFNLYSIVLFLPIEMLFHPLERFAGATAELFTGSRDASVSGFNVLDAATDPPVELLLTAFSGLTRGLGGMVTIVVGISLVIASVLYLGKLLRAVMTGRAKSLVDRSIGRGPISGVLSGTIITVLVQSSSTSTSLIVPLAGAGTLSLRQVYPYTLGANIGTCVTALLAATAVSGANEVFAMQIALVHLLYNVVGVVLFLAVPWVKDLPVRSAEWLGNRVEHNRSWAFAYIVGVFFAMPGAVFAGEVMLRGPAPAIAEAELNRAQQQAAEEDVELSELAIE